MHFNSNIITNITNKTKTGYMIKVIVTIRQNIIYQITKLPSFHVLSCFNLALAI